MCHEKGKFVRVVVLALVEETGGTLCDKKDWDGRDKVKRKTTREGRAAKRKEQQLKRKQRSRNSNEWERSGIQNGSVMVIGQFKCD